MGESGDGVGMTTAMADRGDDVEIGIGGVDLEEYDVKAEGRMEVAEVAAQPGSDRLAPNREELRQVHSTYADATEAEH